MKRLDRKVALVTGASSGIGRAVAVAFAREGAQVVAVARRSKELSETVELATRAGGHARAYVADVTRESQVLEAVHFAEVQCGRLDTVFHAAGGIFATGLTDTLAEAEFRSWLDSYLISAFLVGKHALAAMLRAGGGSLINVGTFVGHDKAIPGVCGYAAAKTGLIGLTRTIAREYAAQNVRANVLISGAVDTPLFRRWNDDENKRAWAASLHALGRVALPEELAAAAVFLASDESSFVTGSTFAVDGGVALT